MRNTTLVPVEPMLNGGDYVIWVAEPEKLNQWLILFFFGKSELIIEKNGRLRDIFPNTYVPSTPEQQAELLKWCQEWDERVEEFL